MPSPFTGMDPFIENQEWSDFHASLIPVIRDALDYTAALEPPLSAEDAAWARELLHTA